MRKLNLMDWAPLLWACIAYYQGEMVIFNLWIGVGLIMGRIESLQNQG